MGACSGLAGTSKKSPEEGQALAGIRALVRDLNRAWVEKRFSELSRFFHPEAVIVASDSGERLVGRAACVKSYRQFMLHSTVHKFKQSKFHADLWDHTAVAGYAFDIRYTTKGVEYHDVGREFFILARTGRDWRVVWRTLVVNAK